MQIASFLMDYYPISPNDLEVETLQTMINKLKTVTSSHSEDEKSLLALNITMAF
jgi:hypothetical protein